MSLLAALLLGLPAPASLLQEPPAPPAPIVVEVRPDAVPPACADLAAARDRVRAILTGFREGGGRPRPVVVEIHDGVYELASPLVLGPEDSGSPGAPVTWRAAPGARPVLSGGRRLSGWTVAAGGTWTLELPAVRAGDWTFSQLFVDGQRRFRPRRPAQGWFHVAAELPPTAANRERGHDRMGFAASDIEPAWAGSDVEVLAIHTWSASRMRLAAVDAEAGAVTFTGPTRTLRPWGAFHKGARYRVENVPDPLVPGRWYLDRRRGVLRYRPLPGEDPERSQVVAPRLETILRLRGDLAGRRFVHDLRFRGLTFAHAAWSLPPGGQSFPQGEVQLGAAVEAFAARDVVLEDCAVVHAGRYAVQVGAGCRRVRLAGCELADLGAGGVKIGIAGGASSWPVGEAVDPDDPETEVAGIEVRGCRIVGGGRLHPAGEGVWIGHASHCAIRGNTIADFFYTGVSVGWTWGYAEPSRAHHNEIAWNDIHDIGQGLLSDLAGVYTLGVSPGTTVHHNRIQDVRSFGYGGWGLYTDEGSSGIAMTHNLVWRCKTGSFHQHYGRDNLVADNILAESAGDQLQRTRTEEHRSFRFERNLVWWTGEGPLLGKNWRDDHFAMDHNLYWNPRHPVRFWDGLDLAGWQARGHDRHSRIADPRFLDPERGDFRLRPDSPAFVLGFEAWDLAAAGRQEPPRLTAGLVLPADWD